MTSGFHTHAHSCVSAHWHVHTSIHTHTHTCTPLMLTSHGPLKTTLPHPKSSIASPNVATFSRVSACLTSLPLPSPTHRESPCVASHPVASLGRINFQLTTGGWPGVSAWPEPRQTGYGTRADYHMQGRDSRGVGVRVTASQWWQLSL